MKPFRKLFYCGLEPYENRYTLQLTDWSIRAFKRRQIDYEIISGTTLSSEINVGQVLDVYGRSYFSLSQMMNLVEKMRKGEVTGDDVIFFEDMFTPGIESLSYIMSFISEKPRVYVRCLAQTIDPDDFTNFWGMTEWMRKYEEMVSSFAIILASNEEMVANIKIAGWKGQIYNISGLAFDKEEVRSRIVKWSDWKEKKRRVVFASRWDREKQPDFFMKLAKRWYEIDPSVEFAVLQGSPLRSNEERFVRDAFNLAKDEKCNFKIYENLTKNQYYELLHNSRVLFNCALQDWTSNTVSEADALETNVLFPAYRSFPEIFSGDHTRLYVPWSLEDAMSKLKKLIEEPSPNMGLISDWTSKTIDRCLDIMNGKGEQWNRTDKDYRKYVSEKKYDLRTR